MHTRRASVLPLIALSVQLLLQYLKRKLNFYHYLQSSSGDLQFKVMDQTLPGLGKPPLPLSTQVVVERLYDRGWCPHRVLNTCSSLDYATLYYLSSLNRNAATRADHTSCTIAGCVAASRLPNATHRTPDCTCSWLQPDMNGVKRLIALGKTPLIQVTKGPSGEIDLQIVEAAPYTRYTAISHIVSADHIPLHSSTKNSPIEERFMSHNEPG